jgi:hypothetical protein
MDHGAGDQRMAELAPARTIAPAIQPRRRKKGPVKKPPDRPLPLPDV